MQRRVRVRQQRRRYLEDLKRVVTAQRAVKRWIARRHEAASVLQQAVRSFLLLRRQERVRRGIVKAQVSVGNPAPLRLNWTSQRDSPEFLWPLSGALQALWRGHCSRRLNDNPKVLKLRHMLRKVSAGAREEDKLCNKTSSALDYLLRYKQFSYILEALKSLGTLFTGNVKHSIGFERRLMLRRYINITKESFGGSQTRMMSRFTFQRQSV